MKPPNSYRAEAAGLPSQTIGSRATHNNKRPGRGEAAYHLGDGRGCGVRGGSGGGGCSGVREGKLEKVAREKLYRRC